MDVLARIATLEGRVDAAGVVMRLIFDELPADARAGIVRALNSLAAEVTVAPPEAPHAAGFAAELMALADHLVRRRP